MKMKTKDIKLANDFFATAPKGARETIVKIIKKSVPAGRVCMFATLENKAKLSAYRVVANEIGLELGDWHLRSRSGTAIAKLN
jgi:hypothetical protein